MKDKNNDMRAYVVGLLESSKERGQRIDLLRYELEHCTCMTETEMIGAMALGHGAGGNGGHTDGHVSDKTFYIALNYRDQADKLNAEIKEEIKGLKARLVKLEQEQERLKHYVSLLEERQAEVIRSIYFQRLSLEETASKVGVVVRTVRKIRDRAVDELTGMYDFTGHLKGPGPF